MSSSYTIEDGVLYVRDFDDRPDYFKNGGFGGIRKIVFRDGIEEIPDQAVQLYGDLAEIVWPKTLKSI